VISKTIKIHPFFSCHNEGNPKYIEHILDTQHAYVKMENTMEALKIMSMPKGHLIDTWE
jgi:hypothetical protein